MLSSAFCGLQSLTVMLIRRASKEDIPSLAAMELEHPGYPAWGERGLAAELGKNFSVTLVAGPREKPAGFINFWVLKPPARQSAGMTEDASHLAGGQVQLNSVVVSVSALKSGVAWALLGKMYEYARKNGCAEIDLEVNERNLPAIRLYERSDFKVVGRRPKFYNNTDGAILMRKRLETS